MVRRLAIAHVGRLGDGVADTPDGPIYVPYTLPGETAEVEEWPGHADRAHLLRLDVASAERIAPICPHFGICGGCAMQHWAAERYREWKRSLVVEALTQVGIATTVDAVVDAHGEGRRRAVLHARHGTRDVLEVGFAARKAHHIVAIDRCPVLAAGLDGAVETAWAIAEKLGGAGKPLDIQVTATDAGIDVDVRGSGPLTTARTSALAEVATRHKLARLTRHGELVIQRAVPTVRMGRARVALPAGAFLQATAAGEEVLAQLTLAHCRGAKTIADLFCGVGPFALRLAEHARVAAFDEDAGAIAALQQAASGTSGLKPITAQRRDLFRRPLVPSELEPFDLVVLDPPRQGAQAQARQLAASTVATIVAVSCNPLTFARDARILIDGGYELAAITPVDQFLYSAHVELVALLRRAADRNGRRIRSS
ncbi:MAG: class I SAM-dependent RNA methyltransferase [Hyphomicrobiales bacterium]|nr:class I SAM-dependent RNA methyltransferase [Hyphomicrobiales bacterium]